MDRRSSNVSGRLRLLIRVSVFSALWTLLVLTLAMPATAGPSNLAALASVTNEHAQAEPPTPIPPGTYDYRGLWSGTSSTGGFSSGRIDSKLTVDAPDGSTQHSTSRGDNCRDNVFERTVDYQPDGIHLVRTYRDTGARMGTNGSSCPTGLSVPQVCNPIPAPLILPTGAKPGQHLGFTMACAFDVHQVSIDIVGRKKVMVEGEWVTTLVVRFREDIIAPLSLGLTLVYSGENWVIPRNGLVVFDKSRLSYYNPAGFTGSWRFTSSLTTCSTCPVAKQAGTTDDT